MLLVPRGVQASIHRSDTVSGESKLEDGKSPAAVTCKQCSFTMGSCS